MVGDEVLPPHHHCIHNEHMGSKVLGGCGHIRQRETCSLAKMVPIPTAMLGLVDIDSPTIYTVTDRGPEWAPIHRHEDDRRPDNPTMGQIVEAYESHIRRNGYATGTTMRNTVAWVEAQEPPRETTEQHDNVVPDNDGQLDEYDSDAETITAEMHREMMIAAELAEPPPPPVQVDRMAEQACEACNRSMPCMFIHQGLCARCTAIFTMPASYHIPGTDLRPMSYYMSTLRHSRSELIIMENIPGIPETDSDLGPTPESSDDLSTSDGDDDRDEQDDMMAASESGAEFEVLTFDPELTD